LYIGSEELFRFCATCTKYILQSGPDNCRDGGKQETQNGNIQNKEICHTWISLMKF